MLCSWRPTSEICKKRLEGAPIPFRLQDNAERPLPVRLPLGSGAGDPSPAPSSQSSPNRRAPPESAWEARLDDGGVDASNLPRSSGSIAPRDERGPARESHVELHQAL